MPSISAEGSVHACPPGARGMPRTRQLRPGGQCRSAGARRRDVPARSRSTNSDSMVEPRSRTACRRAVGDHARLAMLGGLGGRLSRFGSAARCAAGGSMASLLPRNRRNFNRIMVGRTPSATAIFQQHAQRVP
jgi:hypothetical protein